MKLIQARLPCHVHAALVNAHGRDDKANLPLDEVYRRGKLLQLRHDQKGAAYREEVYQAMPKAATHDYQGTAGYKLVISTHLLQHRSTRAQQLQHRTPLQHRTRCPAVAAPQHPCPAYACADVKTRMLVLSTCLCTRCGLQCLVVAFLTRVHVLATSQQSDVCFHVAGGGVCQVAEVPAQPVGGTAFQHGRDLLQLVEEWRSWFVIPGTERIKPVMVLMVDGEQDENPRFYGQVRGAGLVCK